MKTQTSIWKIGEYGQLPGQYPPVYLFRVHKVCVFSLFFSLFLVCFHKVCVFSLLFSLLCVLSALFWGRDNLFVKTTLPAFEGRTL